MDKDKYIEICKEYGIRLTINPENYNEARRLCVKLFKGELI